MATDIKDIIIPGLGALNSDDDYQSMSKHDSPCSLGNKGRLNVIYSEGNLGVLSKIKGNELETYSFPAGTNTIIGGCEDRENNAFIFFVHNSNNNHCIIRYNFNATFTAISSNESTWGFSTSYPINKAGIIGTGNDAQFVFTDNYNEIRKANIANLIAGSYATLHVGNINLLKPSPYQKLTATIGSDTDIDTNDLLNKVFQFSYSYVFDSGEESVPAPYTDWQFCDSIEFVNGYRSYYNNLQNKITLSVTPEYANVEYVKIYMRYSDTGIGKPSLWFLYDIIEYNGSGAVGYIFYNNKNYGGVDQDNFNRLYDDVPQTAKTLEILSTNRICLGEVKKGYDLISVDGTVTLEQVDKLTAQTAPSWTNALISSAASSNAYSFHTSGLERSCSVILSKYSTTDSSQYFYLPSTYNMSKAEVNGYMRDLINDNSIYDVTATLDGSNNLVITNNESYILCYSAFYFPLNTKEESVKDGAIYYLGIQYYDSKMRSMGVVISDDTEVYIDSHNNTQGGNVNTYLSRIKYTISHTPQTGAAYWSWVIGGSSVSNWFQIPMLVNDTIHYDYFNHEDYITDFNKEHKRIAIYLDQMIDRTLDNKWYKSVKTFDVKKGDRIRFKGYFEFAIGDNQHKVFLFDEFIDMEILSVEEGVIYIENWDSYTNSDYLNGTQQNENTMEYDFILCEIYRKDTNINKENLIYEEVGDILNITGGYHMASTESGYGVSAQNQTAVLDAVGTIKFTNAYKYYQLFSYFELKWALTNIYTQALYPMIETKSASMLYASDIDAWGRINIYDPDFKQRTYKAVQYGGTYSEDGFVFNELNRFELEGNMVYLDDKYGSIYQMYQEGYTLNVIQQSKVTPIGVGVDEIANQDGSISLVALDTVLGKPRPLSDDGGCIFPQAVVPNGRYIYFPDIYAGEVYRKAPNGLIPISDYKMSKYIRDKFRDLLESGVSNITMYGGYDPINKLYLLTMKDSSDATNNETIAFHEPSNRWISWYSFVPQLYGKIGDTIFLSFYSGTVYKHYSGSANYCNFYGSDYDSECWILGNEAALLTKRFNSIDVDANKKWSAEDNSDIVVYSDSVDSQDVQTYITYSGDMVSRLKAGQFKYREGVFKADFLRDATTTTGSFTVKDLITGRPLRGRYILVKLKNSDTIFVVLRSVMLNSAISK